MRFVWTKIPRKVGTILALGILAGCAPSLETTPVDVMHTDALAGPSAAASLRGELPAAAGHFGPGREVQGSHGNSWTSRMIRPAPGGGWGSIQVTRGEAAGIEPGRPTQPMIAAELAALFERTAMKIVEDQLYNAYGPFGLAVGHDGQLSCAYAWQWVRDQPRLVLSAGEAVSVRIALCLPRTGPAALAALVRQLALKPSVVSHHPGNDGPVQAPSRGVASNPAQAWSGPMSEPNAGRRRYLAPLSFNAAAPAAPGRVVPGVLPPRGAPIIPLPSAE